MALPAAACLASDGNGGGDRRGTERASGGDGGGLLAALPMTSDLPTEYTIVADAALVKGLNGSGYSAGVTFHQTDGTQFYHFRLDHGVKASSQLLRWPDKKSTYNLPASQETTVTDGQAYRLRVTVSGEKMIGYVDSVKQFEYDASAAGGKVGLRVYNAVALFDNIAVYSGVVAPEGAEQAEDLTLAGTTPEIKDPEIFVNQIGYDNGTSMRATIPNADGKEFKVVNRATGEAAYTGTAVGGIADFTGLTADTDTTFYITCADKQQSYDFEIGTNLIQRRSMKQALAFMVQTRSDANVKGDNAIAWRDSHQFSFELNGLVLQYMANPSVYDNMPQTIFAEGTYVGTNKLTGTEYEDLKTQNEPDIIWLIKFAARRYYDWGCTQGKKLHMLTKEQLAYYLYLAPELIARGNNLWDIRKAVCLADLSSYTFHTSGNTIDQEYWTGAAYALADGQNPSTTPKNEPGNQAGLQAVMYAAARVLKDDAETTNRLHALGVAAIDDLFGRNPTGTAAFYHFKRDFTGGDAGWYKQYSGGAGRLEGCTAVIDANAPEFCYRNGGYNPSKDYQNNSSPTPRAGSPITRRGMLLWPTVRRKMLRCLSTRRAAMWATR